MTHFQQNQVVYSIENFNKYTVISREQNKYKVINQNKEYEVFDQTQLTDDKDIIIQKMHINIQQLQTDYKDSREAWWRLKDEMLHYKKLALKK